MAKSNAMTAERALRDEIAALRKEADEKDEQVKQARWSNDQSTASYYDGFATGIRQAVLRLERVLAKHQGKSA